METGLLLKNCFAVWPGAGDDLLRNTDILIKGPGIVSVSGSGDGEGATATGLNADDPGQEAPVRIIDCSDHIVIPGLVNTHHHFYQTLTRNIPAVQDAELFDWLVHLYDIWKHLDEEAIYYSSMLAMGELLKTGCTLSTDHHYLYPEAVETDIMATQFKAARTLGIRFSPTRGSMSLGRKNGGLPPDSVVQTEEEILGDSERVIHEFHDPSDWAMNKVVLAPCSPFSVSRALMKDTADLARKHHVRLHTHLAETRDENDYCMKTYGTRPLDLMESCGFTGEDVSYAHGIHFDDAELERIKESGTHIAHCPTSNMRLGSGICRVVEMNRMGINVGLAVDGSASNDSSDMLGEVRNALLLQRVKYGAAAINARDVLTMATINGARMLNFNRIGRVEKGYAADLAVFNIRKMEYAGALSDPLAALVFSGYNHATTYTIVNGKLCVDNGNLVGASEDTITGMANALSEQMIRRHENHGSR
ncbi:MAG: 8-oxoguanine deaminase [Desulfobacteraceae bacterium]|nr:MAG: 8-oxoguanine deaminase [Desulfobacteraceae bacterium]